MPFGAFKRRPRDSPPPTRSLDTLIEARAAAAPRSRLLELRGQPEDERFATRRPHQLDPDRQTGRIDAERKRYRRLPRAVVWEGEADEIHVLVSGRRKIGAERAESGHGSRHSRRAEHVVRVPEAATYPAEQSNRVDG